MSRLRPKYISEELVHHWTSDPIHAETSMWYTFTFECYSQLVGSGKSHLGTFEILTLFYSSYLVTTVTTVTSITWLARACAGANANRTEHC